MRQFFCLILIVFFNLTVFSEELDLLNIKLSKLEKELSLKEEQKEKMFNLIKKEDEETKKPVILYDVVNDPIDKIIKIEKELYEKKEQSYKSFLNNSQFNIYESLKVNSIKDKFTLYLLKGLELDNRQSLLLNTFTPLAVKKMNLVKGNTVNYEPSKDNVKKVNDIFTALELGIFQILTPPQKKLYEENRKKILPYLLNDVLGFEVDSKERANKSKKYLGGILF